MGVMRRGMIALSFMVIANLALAEGLKVGDVAPAWENLPGTDGKSHSLADLKDAKVVVVAFTCNHCPVAVAYEDRFIEFAKEYAKKGVEFVAISVNSDAADKLPKMIERAKEKDFPFAYLYDESQKIGRAFSATKTPHLFVLDQDRKLAFVGAFDDKMDVKRVEKKYVQEAVDALLHGKEVAVKQTPAHGCGISYE